MKSTAHNVGELVLGIDEAGRGPIIGPLVMAAVALRPTAARKLTRLGVTDSKGFAGRDAHEARSSLVPFIHECADFFSVQVIDVRTVDHYCRGNGLNRLERLFAHRMIAAAPVCKRIVCDGHRLFAPLGAHHPRLEARDGGELVHAAVAAASILAKVRRDTLWHKIAQRYTRAFGEHVHRGGGYTNAATHRFLRSYVEVHRAPPPEARRSWPWDFAHDLLGAAWDRWGGIEWARALGVEERAPCDIVAPAPSLQLDLSLPPPGP